MFLFSKPVLSGAAIQAEQTKKEILRQCLVSPKEQHDMLACEGREQGLAMHISTAVLLSCSEEAAVCAYSHPRPRDLGNAEYQERLQPAPAVCTLSGWSPGHSLPQLLLSSKDLFPSFIPFISIHICIIEKKILNLLPHIIKFRGGKGQQ